MNLFQDLLKNLAAGQQMAAPLTAALLNALWQSFFLVLGLHLGLKLLPRLQAAHRFLLWLAAFLLVALLPLAPLGLGSGGSAPLHAPATAAPLLCLDSRWSLLLAAAWLLLAVVRSGFLLLHAHRAHQIGRAAQPVAAPAGLQAELTLPVRRRVQVCASARVEKPCVVGLVRPRILVPGWLLAELSADELRQIVLHELEHLRRFDDLTNLLQKIFLALMPLNPGLFFAERQLCREREMACDEGVVRRTRAPRAYAACLASVAERGLLLRRQAEALALGLFRRRPELVERVERLLSRPRELPRALRLSLAGAMACALLAATFTLGRLPQFVGFSSADAPAAVAALGKTPALLPAPALAPGKIARKPHPQTAVTPAASQTEEVAASEPTEFLPAEASGQRAQRVSAPMNLRQPEVSAASASFTAEAQPMVVFAVYEETLQMDSRNQSVSDYETGEQESVPVVVVRRWTVVAPATAQPHPANHPEWMIFAL